MGKYIHTEIARRDLLPNHPALGNSLVDMYAKCGHLITAEQVFKGLPVPGTIAWSALISGYVQHGQADKALDCYKQMECKGLFPNAVTFASVLKACGCVGAAEIGGQVHEVILKEGLLANDYVLGSALVDMYTKCSCLSKAHQVLEQLPAQNVFSWNALMAGYAHQGRSDDVLYCFKQMQSKGISPDAVTFSTLLNICSHNGLVEEGQMFFGIMSSKFSIEPSTEHYTCMVDLLGRSGHLDTAVTLIKKMPAANHSVIWSALLGACQKWDDVHVGKWAFEHAIQVDKYDDTAYIVMIKIYTGAGLDTEAERVKAMRAEARHEKAQRHCVC
ncbi:hypothetical protein KP509_29G078100 [Ceratopteris richardii]|nr:hypothetical protein KP509_29G078100 [Ceratopteris richardii]